MLSRTRTGLPNPLGAGERETAPAAGALAGSAEGCSRLCGRPVRPTPGAGRKRDRRGMRLVRICSLRDAVAELVGDGDMVPAEGFAHLTPHAAGHEIIRQGPSCPPPVSSGS